MKTREQWQTKDADVQVMVAGEDARNRTGEAHAYEAKLIHLLQDACNKGDYRRFKAFSAATRCVMWKKPARLVAILVSKSSAV